MTRASAPRRRWIVSYDLSDPRRRRRLARLLEGEGVRLQRSVFAVEATPDQIGAVRRRCEALLQHGDALFVYAVGATVAVPWASSPQRTLAGYWLA